MAKRGELRVLVATDGSSAARAALSAAVLFPWPERTRVRGILARRKRAQDRSLKRLAATARTALARRWPEAQTAIVEASSPVKAVLSQAERFSAGAIVVGSRGHGAIRRLLTGSVSRGVVRRARCPVLVVQHRPRKFRSLVVGFDGSTNARRATRFVAGLEPARDTRITLVRVVEPIGIPQATGLPRSVRATLRHEGAALNARRLTQARRALNTAARGLQRSGWTVERLVRTGIPLRELLATVTSMRADALVVGARGIGGVRRLVLGSVAKGALQRSPVAVLVVR